jgi:predicted TIM-barrel enzyme
VVDGLYQFDRSVPISGNSPLVGQSINTMIGTRAEQRGGFDFWMAPENGVNHGHLGRL